MAVCALGGVCGAHSSSHMRMLACTHARTHARTHAHTHARTHSRTHSYAPTHPPMQTCTHALAHPRTHAPTHASAHASTHRNAVYIDKPMMSRPYVSDTAESTLTEVRYHQPQPQHQHQHQHQPAININTQHTTHNWPVRPKDATGHRRRVAADLGATKGHSVLLHDYQGA